MTAYDLPFLSVTAIVLLVLAVAWSAWTGTLPAASPITRPGASSAAAACGRMLGSGSDSARKGWNALRENAALRSRVRQSIAFDKEECAGSASSVLWRLVLRLRLFFMLSGSLAELQSFANELHALARRDAAAQLFYARCVAAALSASLSTAASALFALTLVAPLLRSDMAPVYSIRWLKLRALVAACRELERRGLVRDAHGVETCVRCAASLDVRPAAEECRAALTTTVCRFWPCNHWMHFCCLRAAATEAIGAEDAAQLQSHPTFVVEDAIMQGRLSCPLCKAHVDFWDDHQLEIARETVGVPNTADGGDSTRDAATV
jgi:hypothetical protein